MAMSVGEGRRSAISSINVTPMADIMIVLLIIFMVTIPLMRQGGVAELPRAPHAGNRLRDCREAGADEVALATHPYR